MSAPLDVVIVSHNTRDDREACLASLAAAPPQALAHIVVVDNASTDGSVDAIRSRWPTVRVVALDTSRETADLWFPEIESKYERQLRAYKLLPDEELFKIEKVTVNVPTEDQPGRPVSRVTCDECGEAVNDHREVISEGRTLCRACAGQAYYTRS